MPNLRSLLPILLVLALAGSPIPAAAAPNMCVTDPAPAATLLLPYFEVDLDDPDAANTLFSINNAAAEPALAHITFWTDWSHPTIDFDVFLTGYDVLQVNLADVFINGNVPITSDAQSDSGDTISPHGGFRPDDGPVGWSQPEWDGDFAECHNFFPFFINPLITGGNFTRLVNGHTGQPIPSLGGCLGSDYEDNVARGYVTVDRVNRCSVEFPSDRDESYFAADGTGIASNANQLWGDWFIVDRRNGYAQGDSLVHIEALDGFDAQGDGTSLDGVADPETGYTFYGRFTTNGEDNREPLDTTWAARYMNNALFAPGGTEFTVWRDPTIDDVDEVFSTGLSCGPRGVTGVGPAWSPLQETEVVAFDEFENAVELCFYQGCGVCSTDKADKMPFGEDPACFGLGTQRMSSVDLAFEGRSSPWGSGWMFLNLNVGDDEAVVGSDFDPGSEGTLSQSFVYVTHSANGLYSVGLPALDLTSACDDVNLIIEGIPTAIN